MSNRRLTFTLLILAAAMVTGQVAAVDKAAQYKAQNDRLKAVFNHIPEKYRDRLSGASRNLFTRATATGEAPTRPGSIDPESAEGDEGPATPRPFLPPRRATAAAASERTRRRGPRARRARPRAGGARRASRRGRGA